MTRSSHALLVPTVLVAILTTGASCLASPIQSGTISSAPRDTVLFYGGDYWYVGSEMNNTMLTPQYGSTNLTDFVVSSLGWHVTGLFSNNVKDYGPAPPTLPALWSIRPEAANGDPGSVLYGGVADASVTPTGRPYEYTVAVSGLSLDLKPGVYFMQLSPIASQQVYYVGHGGPNAVGTSGPSASIYEYRSVQDGQPVDEVGHSSVVPSMGVVGEVIVPEPGTVIVFGVIIVSLGVAKFSPFARHHGPSGPSK